MRWVLHGNPGTGKSHTIKKLCALFEDVVGYRKDIDYKIMVLQATMATKIDGDTLHHGLHFKRGQHATSTDPSTPASEGKLNKELMTWRWLIIDEISMISTRFLATCDYAIPCAQ